MKPRGASRAPLLQNVAWLSAGNVLVKPLWFVFITAACMRVLQAEGYGVLTATMSLAAFAPVLTELGTGDYATREVARHPEESSQFFSSLLVGRLCLTVVATVGILAVGAVLGYERESFLALGFAALYHLMLRLTEFCRIFYRAFEVLRYEAVSVIAERLLVIGTGLVGLLMSRSPAGTLLGMAAGMTVTLFLNVAWVHIRLTPFRLPLVRWGFLVKVYRKAFPVGLFGLFTVLLLSNGPILIEVVNGEAAAGRYGAAYRIVEMLMLMPSVVCVTVLPRLSRLFHQEDRAGYSRVLYLSILGVGGLAMLIAAGLSLAGPFVIQVLAPGGDFDEAGELLRLLAWVFPFMSLTMLLAYALIAFDEQRFLALLVGVAASVSLVANLVLIPQYSYYAAASVLIAGHAFIVLVGLGRVLALRQAAPPPVSLPTRPSPPPTP